MEYYALLASGRGHEKLEARMTLWHVHNEKNSLRLALPYLTNRSPIKCENFMVHIDIQMHNEVLNITRNMN